jgi:acetyl-CoA decarbonylase/synthase, CODH/ACS complex subunit gamma
MEIKASDIKDKLPEMGKKNCKECGVPTCFAFALKLSKGQAELSACPHLDPMVRQELDGLLSPPMKLITLGSGDRVVQIGDERVMFRHEQGFSHEPALAVAISDRETNEDIDRKIKQVDQFQYERIGKTYRADLLALKFDSGDRARFEEMAKKAYETSALSAVIISEDLDALFAARDVYFDRKPLIYPITEKNIDAALSRIKERPTPVGLKTDSVEALIPLTEKLNRGGITELVLDPSPKDIFEAVQQQTIIRRSAVVSKFRSLGYPAMALPFALTTDPLQEIVLASALVAKYANLIVLSALDEARLFPLFLLREDIYVDPRFMRQVPPKIYEIGVPDMDSPVLATVNAAITYFMVRAEVEQSKVPAWLAVLDTGGFSVQTALGTNKFGGSQIAGLLKEHGLAERNRLKKIIIPRPAHVIKEDLEANLPGWEVVIGPELAKEIQPMMKKLVQ